MQNDMRDRLIRLINETSCVDVWDYYNDTLKKPNPVETLADYLIANDVVPVFRCCKCIHLKTNIDKETYCDFHSSAWEKVYIRPDDYCSYGERKADNG